MADAANYWMANSTQLAEAYERAAGWLRFELVTRVIGAALGRTPARILDIGGGYGEQAICLARLGHSVTIVDCDSIMLDMAREKIGAESQAVSDRIVLHLGEGASAPELTGRVEFDATCCHSVLLYEEKPRPLLSAMVESTRSGGLLSIISINHEARAMRSGLQKRWRQAIATLEAGTLRDDAYLPTVEHDRKEIIRILSQMGAHEIGWHGIGIFTDHFSEPIVVENALEVLLCEWLAGTQDPYRRIARTFHLLARVGEEGSG